MEDSIKALPPASEPDPKNRGGRPSKFCPTRARRAIKAMEQTNSLRCAAAAAGVAESTLARWRREFRRFRLALKRAAGRWEAAHVQNIAQAGAKSWQASAWLLERRLPGSYARPKVQIDPEQLDREIASLLQQLAQQNAAMQTPLGPGGLARPLRIGPVE